MAVLRRPKTGAVSTPPIIAISGLIATLTTLWRVEDMRDRRTLNAAANERFQRGDYGGALAPVERHADLLGDDIERGWFRMCLRSRTGDRVGVVAAFADVVGSGGWFDGELLAGEQNLDLLRDDPTS